MARSISPFALGATLYMPAIHPAIMDFIRGEKHRGVRSIVLCLEDALLSNDVDAGLANLRQIMIALKAPPLHPRRPLIFVRPRSIAMAQLIASWPDATVFDGFVAPKSRPGEMRSWYEAVDGSDLLLMPTLETAEFFDPIAIHDFRDEVLGLGAGRILAMRIGGNDLLACLGLRRIRGLSVYDGPLGSVIGCLVAQLGSAGFSLTAPVFEILNDAATLQSELVRDVAHGLVGKTAIHPDQVPYINDAFRVSQSDCEAALQILDVDAAAVFKLHGAMCEPKTHAAWARNIMTRAETYGQFEERAIGPWPALAPMMDETLEAHVVPFQSHARRTRPTDP